MDDSSGRYPLPRKLLELRFAWQARITTVLFVLEPPILHRWFIAMAKNDSGRAFAFSAGYTGFVSHSVSWRSWVRLREVADSCACSIARRFGGWATY